MTSAAFDESQSLLASQTTRRQERLRDVAAFGLILAFALALCAPVLVGRVPVASDTLALWAPWSNLPHEPVHNQVLADSALHYLSWLVYSRDSIAAGEWPLWDPYAFSGFPYVANSQNQLYYPLTWLRWLLPLSAAIQLLPIFNICVAGWGMYVLMRWLSASRVGSLVAALSFAGSGMIQLSIEATWISSVYCWLPFMLYAADRALQSRGWTWVAVATIPCAMQALAGNLQWVLYSYFTIGCWTLWRAGERLRGEGWRSSTRILARGVIVLFGGLALAAIHLVPFAELLSQTTRGQGRTSSNSWPLTYLLRMVMPQYFNTAAPGVGPPMVFNDLWTVGILPLLLAAIALITRARRYVWFWAGMGLFAILVTFGIGPFLYVRWLPGLQALLPMRIGYLLIFSLALLAGLGYDAWMKLLREKRRSAIVVLLSLASLLGIVVLSAWIGQLVETDAALGALKAEQVLRGSLLALFSVATLALPLVIRNTKYAIRTVGAIVALGVLAIDLLTMVPGYNTFTSPEALIPNAPSVDWLKAQGGDGRVMGVDVGAITFNPNTQSLYGFPSVNGYDSYHWRRYEDYWSIVDPSVRQAGVSSLYSNLFLRPQAYTSTLASLLSVKYVAAAADLQVPLDWQHVYTGEIQIYENPSALPRTYLVGTASILSEAEIQRRLATPSFDPHEEVLLDQGQYPPVVVPSRGATESTLGDASITSYKRNSVTVEVDVREPSWLVLSDPNYPGWGATVDGVPQKVYTANYILRSVPLTPGKHLVVFSYWPTFYWPAMVVSGTSVLLVCAVILVGWARRRGVRGLNRTLIQSSSNL